MEILDKFLGIENMDKGKLISDAKRYDQYYRAFVKVSGYSWAFAIITGGVAFGAWKLFSSPAKIVKEHVCLFPPFNYYNCIYHSHQQY